MANLRQADQSALFDAAPAILIPSGNAVRVTKYPCPANDRHEVLWDGGAELALTLALNSVTFAAVNRKVGLAKKTDP
jgi:hypothetical protein